MKRARGWAVRLGRAISWTRAKRGKKQAGADSESELRAYAELGEFFSRHRIPKTEIARLVRYEKEKTREPNPTRLSDFDKTNADYAYLYSAMLRHAKNISGKHILHMASTHGAFMHFLQEKGAEAVALDVDKQALRIGAERGLRKPVIADAKKQPFADNAFDILVAEHFLVSDYLSISGISSALREAKRVLKPGGLLIDSRGLCGLFLERPEMFRVIGFKVIELDKKRHMLVLQKPASAK